MNILITGASGMVGRYLKKLLPNALTPSSRELDLTNSEQVKYYFANHKFDYVIHLAAHVGSLHDNIENRTAYFDNNILMNTLVTKYSFEFGIKNFLGILSTCIYPNNIKIFPIKECELHVGAPHISLMSYVYAKRSHAVQLDAYKESFGVNYNYLIPCNLYGIVSKNHEKRSHFVNDLIFKILDAQKNKRDHIVLFGDGSPLRQFMHAYDFATIISLYVTNKLNSSFNVAPDEHSSVEKIALNALSECDPDNQLFIKYDDSKPNGQLRKDVDTSKFKKHFKDFKFKTLKEGIRETYDHYKRDY